MPTDAVIDPGPDRHQWCATCKRCGHTAAAAEPEHLQGKWSGRNAAARLALVGLRDTCPQGRFTNYVETPVPVGVEVVYEWRGEWKAASLYQKGLFGLACEVPTDTPVRVLIAADRPQLRADAEIVLGRLVALGYKPKFGGVGTLAKLRAAAAAKGGGA